jgi:very-short-patch-repair endonuclease
VKTPNKRDGWPTDADAHAHMRKRQQQNRARQVPAEDWMAKRLKVTGLKWKLQVQWGFRLFDFWCSQIGINVEVDGATHSSSEDVERDAVLMKRSGIIVLRVRNYNEDDARLTLTIVAKAEPWNDRRKRLGLKVVHHRKVVAA